MTAANDRFRRTASPGGYTAHFPLHARNSDAQAVAHPATRLVLTVEPGLYVRPAKDVPKKF